MHDVQAVHQPQRRDAQLIRADQRINSLLPPTVDLLANIGASYVKRNIGLFINDLHSPRESMRMYGHFGLIITILAIVGIVAMDHMDNNNLQYTKGVLAFVGATQLMQTIGVCLKGLIRENEHLSIYAGIISTMLTIGILYLLNRRNL
jgi:hypothetical protein